VPVIGTADGIPRLRAGLGAALACHRHAIHYRSVRIPFPIEKTAAPLRSDGFLAKDCYFNKIGVIVKFRNA
jgi:hypothetical protein